MWKAVKDYEGFYEVSDEGEVRSLSRVYLKLNRWGQLANYTMKGRVLKHWKDAGGYTVIYLCNKSKEQRVAVNIHRLVATAFIANPDNLSDVNHKDGVKNNNHVDNLEWMNRSDNNKHAVMNGKIASNEVYAYNLDGTFYGEFFNSRIAAEHFGRKGGNSIRYTLSMQNRGLPHKVVFGKHWESQARDSFAA